MQMDAFARRKSFPSLGLTMLTRSPSIQVWGSP